MKKCLLVSFLFLFSLHVTIGQNLIATATPSKLSKGEITRVVYHFEGDAEGSINLPEFLDFSVVSGPSRRQSVSIINGRKSSTLEVSVDLIARKSGVIKIPEASIRSRGRIIKSNVVIVNVNEHKVSTTLPDRLKDHGYVIVAEANKDTVYQGEQIVITYRLYYSKDVERHQITYESEYPGCVKAEFILDEPSQLDTINGIIFRKATLLRRALFPYQAGTHKVDPMVANLYVFDESKPYKGYSFFSKSLKTVKAYSDELQFEVLPQQVNELDSLLALEPVEMQFKLPDSLFTTDDLIPISAWLRGSSDPSLLRAPGLQTDFPIYYTPPKTIEFRKSADDDGISYINSFDYFIQPQDTGVFRFRFYSPYLKKTGEIDTLFSPEYEMRIHKGVYYDELIVHEKGKSNSGRNLLYISLGLLVILAAGIGIRHLRKQKKETIKQDKNASSPLQLIQSELAVAGQSVTEENRGNISNSLLKTLRMTAAAILGKDVSLNYNTQDIYQQLMSEKPEIADDWKHFIEQLERMQYGKVPDSAEIRHIQVEVVDWVTDKFPFIEDNN